MLRSTDLPPLSRVVRRVDAAADGASTGDSFATGFPSIDKWLGGGLRRGDLVVVGGEAGVGKSALALAIALRMAQSGTNAAYFSAEMAGERVMERALAIEGRAKVDDIRQGALDDITRAAVGGAALRMRDRAPRIEGLSPGGMQTLGDALRRIVDLQVVFIDSLQALALGQRNLEEEVAYTVQSLKSLAVELGVVVVATSAMPGLTAGRFDLRPTLADFGGLGAVKQHADVVLGVYREEMHNTDRGVDGATELLVLKNRNGSTGYVDLYFYKQWLRFEDMLDPDR